MGYDEKLAKPVLNFTLSQIKLEDRWEARVSHFSSKPRFIQRFRTASGSTACFSGTSFALVKVRLGGASQLVQHSDSKAVHHLL
jgi:hypothetical protein